MTSPLLLSEAQQAIGRRRSEEQPPEQARILGLARDSLDFISATGQWYPFEDFRVSRASLQSSQASDEEGSEGLRELKSKTESFFEKLLGDPAAVGEQEPIQLILDALRFISSPHQHEAFADFIAHVETRAPPYVVASFATQAEAEAWLRRHQNPPAFADILVGDRYHDVVYERETDFRRLPWNRHLERYLGWLVRVEAPVADASFATHEEAEAWLTRQPHPARRTWVMIAGELYLAAYYPNINHRALHPLSMAENDVEEPEGQ
jgi:hypothetical protein